MPEFAKTDHHNFAANMKPKSHCCNCIGCNFEPCQRFSVTYTGIEQREIKLKITSSTLLWSAMSFKKIVCERLTEEARWYSTSWFKELNFTTHKKYFPAPSRKILKCCTLPPNLQNMILRKSDLLAYSKNESQLFKFWCLIHSFLCKNRTFFFPNIVDLTSQTEKNPLKE